jgi:hypothetical protein
MLPALIPFTRYYSNFRNVHGRFDGGLALTCVVVLVVSIRREGLLLVWARSDIPGFRNLTRLSIGISNIQDEGSIALFLSH